VASLSAWIVKGKGKVVDDAKLRDLLDFETWKILVARWPQDAGLDAAILPSQQRITGEPWGRDHDAVVGSDVLRHRARLIGPARLLARGAHSRRHRIVIAFGVVGGTRYLV
jgi:hypothetical protein